MSRLVEIPGVSRGIPGVTLDHFIYDSMRVMELGVCGYVAGRTLRMLLDIKYYGYFTDGEHAEVNAAMSEALRAFYTSSRTPDDMRIHSLTVLMLGEEDTPFLKLKAAKSRRFLPFIIDTLQNQGGALALGNSLPMGCEGSKLLEVANAIAMYFEILKREPRKMSEASLLNLEHTIGAAIDAWGALGLPFQMKWHAFGKHFVSQCRSHGNVLYSHNFRDESENAATRRRSSSLFRSEMTRNFLTKWMVEFLLGDVDAQAGGDDT
eukprot:12187-Pyramimonas_sp.AAC.1